MEKQIGVKTINLN